ncbi:MAG: hypothetical protein WCC00_09025 [Candidatus Aminicenantales bacterium]
MAQIWQNVIGGVIYAPAPGVIDSTHEAGWSQGTEGGFMMNHANGWMNGWLGGGMWLWTVIGILVVVLLVVVIRKLLKK